MNDDFHRPVLSLISEFFDSFVGADSRILRTIPNLIFRPGFLTAEVRAGRRARYASPLRLYLVVSLMTFLVVSLGNVALLGVEVRHWAPDEDDIGVQLSMRSEQRGFARFHDRTHNIEVELLFFSRLQETDSDLLERLKLIAESDTGGADDNLFGRFGFAAVSDPAQFNRVLNDYLATLYLLQVVIFGVFSWMLHARSVPYAYDHAVFALHYQSFGLILLMIGLGIAHFVPAEHAPRIYGGFVVPLGIVYLFVALKWAFGRGWLSTSLRFLAMLVLMMITILTINVAGVWLAAETVAQPS